MAYVVHMGILESLVPSPTRFFLFAQRCLGPFSRRSRHVGRAQEEGRARVGRRVPRCTTNVIPSVRRSSSSSTAVSDAPPEWAARLLATTTTAVPPRHLCFDLDHTLWDFTVEWEGAFTRVTNIGSAAERVYMSFIGYRINIIE